MKKINTIFLAIIFTVLFSVNLFSAETGGQAGQTAVNAFGVENITDEEMGWPQKFKMGFTGGWMKHLEFYLLGKAYRRHWEPIYPIIDLTDLKTRNLFKRFLRLFKTAEDNYDTSPLPEILKLAQAVTESYNAFINSNSPETTKLKEYFKKIQIQKKREEERERQEEIRLHNSVTSFIGLKATMCLDMGGGLHFAFFFPKSENLKIGFAVDLMYRNNFLDISTHYRPDEPGFMGIDILFTTKCDWFNFYIGGGIYRRVSKQIVTHDFGGSYLKISDYEVSAIMSLGYLYDGRKFKFFGGFGFRVILNNSVLENDHKMYVSRLRFTIDLIFGF